MTKSFKELYEEKEEVYNNYRIKTVKPLTNEDLEAIERLLQKYFLVDMSEVRRTMLQKHPLDFTNVNSGEVYIIDISTQLPISPYVLRQELKLALDVNEEHVVIHSENDPNHLETERINAFDEMEDYAEEDDVDPASLLSTSPEYEDFEKGDDGEFYYGDEYVDSFKKVLANMDDDNTEEYEPSDNSLFQWLERDNSDSYENDFNQNIKDAPKVYPKDRKHDVPTTFDKALNQKSKYGNIDAEDRTYGKMFKSGDERHEYTKKQDRLRGKD